jgi:hypothetical protein
MYTFLPHTEDLMLCLDGHFIYKDYMVKWKLRKLMASACECVWWNLLAAGGWSENAKERERMNEVIYEMSNFSSQIIAFDQTNFFQMTQISNKP